jgi:hypothetical protein
MLAWHQNVYTKDIGRMDVRLDGMQLYYRISNPAPRIRCGRRGNMCHFDADSSVHIRSHVVMPGQATDRTTSTNTIDACMTMMEMQLAEKE